MRGTQAIIGGVAGAVALTVIHELGKRKIIGAPRVDKLGMQSIKKVLGRRAPEGKQLFRLALASDLVSNALYYTIAGLTPRPVLTGAFLGAGAGIGVITLPKKLGLNNTHVTYRSRAKAMSFSYYLLGGIVSGVVARMVKEVNKRESKYSEVSERKYEGGEH